ncbi:hypothetical protein VB776_24215 [Arcicella sp. DC2W]|uniref:Lipoprotein n=1 Tax=Arcicella gelida TaxID=2984195 RepID=A0ABU5SC78_9BACT|nr:hypothetical protein [Arcicella sp. DC2W]MEA5406066.1 hypothetical protein [Arcicella sp. DC2W]
MTIFFSCGHRNNNSESKIDTIDNPSVDTFSTQPINKQIYLDNNCSYDNQVSSLGIGLIIAPSKFEIYNDSLLSDKIASWDMYEDESKMNLCSKFFKPDYGIMHFVCIAKSEKAYKVLVNFSDIKYLPKTKNYEFKTWDEYISQSFGIRRLTNDNGDISKKITLRIKPVDNSDTLASPLGLELFCPMEIKGDWIKVRYDCFYNDENNSYEGEPCHNYIDKCKNPLTGWLRWRQENHLLIDIFLMP